MFAVGGAVGLLLPLFLGSWSPASADPVPQQCDAAQHPNANIIIGTDGDDVLFGTNGPDRICGLGGNDIINGLNGADVISGGTGDDEINGGNGSDTILGNEGDDELVGGTGNDHLAGNEGNDRIYADDHAPDGVFGGPGSADTCVVDADDTIDRCEIVFVSA